MGPPAACRVLAEFQFLVAALEVWAAVRAALEARWGTAARAEPAAHRARVARKAKAEAMALVAMAPGPRDAVQSPSAPTQRQFASEGSAASAIRMQNAQVENATAIKAIASGKNPSPKK